MKNIIFFLLSLIILSSCSNQNNSNSKPQNSIIFSNDMENAASVIPAWVNESTVNEGIAHSGKFAIMMDSTREYSYSFQNLLNNINDKNPKRMVVSAWIFSTIPNPDASFVVGVDKEPGKYEFWQSGDIKTQVTKANEWTEATWWVTFDKTMTPDSKISVMMWNPHKLKFYIDDMNITFEY